MGLQCKRLTPFGMIISHRQLSEIILQYGGLNNGFAEPDGDFEIQNIHKESVSVWLANRTEVSNFDLQIIEDDK